MASIRCLCSSLVRNSVFTVRTGQFLQKPPICATSKLFRNIISVSGASQWVTWCKYSTHSLGPAHYSHSRSKHSKSELGLDEKIKSEDRRNSEQEKEKKEDEERKWRAMKFSFAVVGVMITSMGSWFIWTYGSPPRDMYGEIIQDEFSRMLLPAQYLYRAYQEANNLNKMIQEPAREQLLPDPLKEPYFQPPYTLVLELRDILVHPEWTYETGWRFKKRPGVDFLLHHCAPPLFEIVIYTNEQGANVFPVIDHLDPNHYIWYRLFKDSTRYVNGKHLKDLNQLNRDLSKVIVIDWDPEAISTPRNHLRLSRWDGNLNDQILVDLGIMLRTIAESEVGDVREVLDYYRTFDDPVGAFKENQRVAQEQELITKQRAQEELQTKGLTSVWTSSFLRRRQ